MIYKKMCSRQQRLEQEITSIQRQLEMMPDGKLVCTHSGIYTKWYQSDGKTSTYIPKKNKKLAEQLAAKKYFTIRLEELLQEQKAINLYLKHHADNSEQSENLLLNESDYSELLSPYFIPLSKGISHHNVPSYE